MPRLGLPELLMAIVVCIIPLIIVGGIAVWLVVVRKNNDAHNAEGVMVNRDEEHLKLLSIFYYIAAGLATLSVCFVAIQVVIGLSMYAESTMPSSNGSLMFIIFSGVLLIITALLTIGSFLTGQYLSQKKNRTFCMIIAGINCLNIPLGTILGIFTIIVLTRPSVVALFYNEKPDFS